MSTRHTAHVVSVAAGSKAASNTFENFNVGPASRRAASACAAAACACACSVDCSESRADDFATIKRMQTRITNKAVQIIKTRWLIMARV